MKTIFFVTSECVSERESFLCSTKWSWQLMQRKSIDREKTFLNIALHSSELFLDWDVFNINLKISKSLRSKIASIIFGAKKIDKHDFFVRRMCESEWLNFLCSTKKVLSAHVTQTGRLREKRTQTSLFILPSRFLIETSSTAISKFLRLLTPESRRPFWRQCFRDKSMWARMVESFVHYQKGLDNSCDENQWFVWKMF